MTGEREPYEHVITENGWLDCEKSTQETHGDSHLVGVVCGPRIVSVITETAFHDKQLFQNSIPQRCANVIASKRVSRFACQVGRDQNSVATERARGLGKDIG